MSEPHIKEALLTNERRGQQKIYRVTCACGWQSKWTSDWIKSMDNHFYRLMRKGLA